jgi:hypothetical protein
MIGADDKGLRPFMVYMRRPAVRAAAQNTRPWTATCMRPGTLSLGDDILAKERWLVKLAVRVDIEGMDEYVRAPSGIVQRTFIGEKASPFE